MVIVNATDAEKVGSNDLYFRLLEFYETRNNASARKYAGLYGQMLTVCSDKDRRWDSLDRNPLDIEELSVQTGHPATRQLGARDAWCGPIKAV